MIRRKTLNNEMDLTMIMGQFLLPEKCSNTAKSRQGLLGILADSLAAWNGQDQEQARRVHFCCRYNV